MKPTKRLANGSSTVAPKHVFRQNSQDEMVILTGFWENGCVLGRRTLLYNMMKDSCQGTKEFVAWQKIVGLQIDLLDGIFELRWQLRKFWQVKKIVRSRSGSLLTDCFAKQTKFCLVQTRPKPLTLLSFSRDLDVCQGDTTCTCVCKQL